MNSVHGFEVQDFCRVDKPFGWKCSFSRNVLLAEQIQSSDTLWGSKFGFGGKI